jgi:Ser/Thr protein kinase RdoA (MazF antagonist)
MNDTLPIDNRVRDAANQLAGANVRLIRSANGGANSRIYRVETTAGTFALKSYPARSNDTRSRAEVEWRTLQFLTSRGVTTVPSPLARDPMGHFLLMEWIDGVAIKLHQPAEIAQAAEFIIKIFDLSSDPEVVDFPLASEACLSPGAIIRQIGDRIPLFAPESALDSFLSKSLLPAFSIAKGNVDSRQQDVELGREFQRLIPADFGFHNVVRQPDGRLRYVDFEYFGWDDPVKLTADFLLHPAMALSADDNRDFVSRITAALPADTDFTARLKRHLPLFALRWALILFNPFRRDRVAELPKDEEARKALLYDRLTKAKKLLRWTDSKTTPVAIDF